MSLTSSWLSSTLSGPQCAATRVLYPLLPSHTVKVPPSMQAAVKEFHIVFLVHVLVGVAATLPRETFSTPACLANALDCFAGVRGRLIKVYYQTCNSISSNLQKYKQIQKYISTLRWRKGPTNQGKLSNLQKYILKLAKVQTNTKVHQYENTKVQNYIIL